MNQFYGMEFLQNCNWGEFRNSIFVVYLLLSFEPHIPYNERCKAPTVSEHRAIKCDSCIWNVGYVQLNIFYDCMDIISRI